MNAFRTNSTVRRAGAVVLLGALVLGGSIATAAAFNGRGSSAGEDPASPAPSAPLVTPEPIVTQAPGPVVTPDPVDSPEPTDGGGDAIPQFIDLETADGHDVKVDVSDLADRLESAASGHPGEGMSVQPYTLNVENVDARTLRLTWVDFGIDNTLSLYLFQGGTALVMVQPEPTDAVDAMGHDRELILTFKEPVSADELEGFLQGGLDTPGDDAS